MDDLEKVRKSGYSFCDGEFHKEVRAVGAPILGLDTTIKGAVVLTIPTMKVKLREIAFFGNKVRKAAEQISLEIGGKGLGGK